MKIRINVKTSVTYILLILCILNCNTIYSTSVTTDYRFPELTAVVLIILFVTGYRNLKIKLAMRWLVYIVLYEAVVVSLLITTVSAEKYIAFIVRFAIFIPVFALCILLENSNRNPWYYFRCYRNLVSLYAAISIVMWFLVCLFDVLPQTGVCRSDWGMEYNYPIYFGIFTQRQTQTFLGVEWIRNQGLFTEAPMYNLILLIAIAIELFINPLYENSDEKDMRDGVNLWRLIILVIADITTFTTTGMILLIAMAALKYCLMKKHSSFMTFVKWLLGVGIITIALFVINSLFIEKSTSDSWIVRSDDILSGIKTWKQSPIFGTGYDMMDAIESNYSSFRLYNMGYSSGFFTVLAQGGIVFTAVYIFGLLGYVAYGIKAKRFELLAFLGVVIILWVMTIFQNSFLMMMLLAYGYAMLISDLSNGKMRTWRCKIEYEKIGEIS